MAVQVGISGFGRIGVFQGPCDRGKDLPGLRFLSEK
jgi:hypothetical protein